MNYKCGAGAPARVPTAAVAASNIRKLTLCPETLNAARTPIGNVTFPRDTCPDRNPKATGIPSSPTIRKMTSSNE